MQEFTSWLMDTFSAFGPWGLFLLALADSSFVPLPQAVDALVMAHALGTPSVAYPGAALAVVGSLVGSLALYEVARIGGRMIIEKRVSGMVLDRTRGRIQKYGALVLVPPTLIPVPLPMAPFVVAAGLFQMNVYHFASVIVLARSVRYFGEAFLVLRYGDQTVAFLRGHTGLAMAVALVVVAALWLARRWRTGGSTSG